MEWSKNPLTLLSQMARHTWRSYKKYAWGSNELQPVSKSGSEGLFGISMNGATIGKAST
jgi:hypothetical protein